MTQEVSLSIVGSGGDGAVAAGDIIAMACASAGLHVIKTEAYGPQIRGGESSCTVRISAQPIYAQAGSLDAIVVFSWSDYARFADELVLADHGVVFYEEAEAPPPNMKGTLVPVPFKQLAGPGKNILALGVLAPLLQLPLEPVRGGVRQRFAKKSAAVIEANLTAFDKGIELAGKMTAATRSIEYASGQQSRLMMSGNEAAAYGAVQAGCKFFAGYPITPSSEILHLLSEWLPKMGGTSLQTEDELSAIGAVIGASFTGAKAMTATSGPGLSLMSEMLGLASIAEIPSVIFNVQRGGPSTGIPTKSEQSDLMHALYASHGDTPRVVLACTDVEDAFHTTVDAFNIAEEYQVPVIVLSDQLIGQRRQTIDPDALVAREVINRRIAEPSDEYRRYADTPDGVSPMSIPGTAGTMYQTNGLEHDETGRPSSMFSVHERMNAKRYRKLQAIGDRYKLVTRLGAERPDVGIICWGSSAGVVREALETLNAGDLRVGGIVPRILAPLPTAELQAFVDRCSEILVIEMSYSGQFHQYLRSQIDLPRAKTDVLARSGGKNLSVNEVISAVRQMLGADALQEVMA